jgi:type VI protein secretion system component VasF
LWDDWQAFQVKARQNREAAAREVARAAQEKKARRARLMEQILLGFWLFVAGSIFLGLMLGAIWLYVVKNRL